MKALIRVIIAIVAFVGVTLAVDLQYQTRLIKSATLTIHVKDGEYLMIRNFTQDNATSGQRGVIIAGVNPTPTPTATATITPTPTATPNSTDLTATKTDNVSGLATFPNPWTWTIHVANGGNTPASFVLFDLILTDNLPSSSNIAYGSPSVTNPVNITNSTAINCGITGSDLSCSASDVVTIGASGSFDVSFTATPTAMGIFANPRAGGGCSVDPNGVVVESNENNNTCADTVVSGTPTPTPTPTAAPTLVSGTVLTATVLNPTGILPSQAIPTGESIKPVIIAGQATLTIDPVSGATLSITYRKFLQRIQPTPTASVTTTTTSISTTTSSSTRPSTSTSSSVRTSQPDTISESMSGSDDDSDFPSSSSSPSPTPTPVPTASPSPTPPAIPTPTPTPSAIPTLTSSPS